MGRLTLAPALLLVVAATAGAAVRVEDVPDPRPASAVADLTGTLRPDTVQALDALAAEVRSQTGGELVVAVVGSVGAADPRGFATALFNRWALGDRQRDDGFLLFVALEEHAAEAILGDGIDDDERVRISQQVMDEVVIARFRQGNPNGAVWHGALAYAERIFGARPSGATAEEGGSAPGGSAPDGHAPDGHAPDGSAPDGQARAAAASVPPPAPVPPDPSSGGGGGPGTGAILGGGGAGLAGGWVGIRAWLRRRPRRCGRCRQPMMRLDEGRDDAHLDAGERREEALKSVDYDVWHCAPCGQAVKLRYGALFTRYSKCPGCAFKTKSATSHTLVQATYSHGGRVRVDESCAHCAYARSYERTTPRLTHSSSTSRGGSSRSGGGSSSGRGASGRW